MITGLRVIWKSLENKFYIILYTILAAASVLLLFSLSHEDVLLVGSLVLSGILYFLLLAILALIPPIWRHVESFRKSLVVQVVLFLSTSLVTPILIMTGGALRDFLIYSGFAVWSVLVGLLACSFAYSISNSVSLRSPHALGWGFIVLAVLLELGLFYEAIRYPIIAPLLLFYTALFFVPCILLAISRYHHPNLFQAYSFIALVYTCFPVAYRLFSLISLGSPPSMRLTSILSSPPIEEVGTAILLIFALNALGNFFSQRYVRLKEGGKRLVSGIRPPQQTASAELINEAIDENGQGPWKELRSEKELLLGPFLIFGLLFSSLAYFAFSHAHDVLQIRSFFEPYVDFIISVTAAIPLLIYLVIRNRKPVGAKASR